MTETLQHERAMRPPADPDRVSTSRITDDAPKSAKELAVIAFRNFLHENFAGPKQVARAFYVELRTAENWWTGRNRASAEIIMLAYGMSPASAARHLTLVVDNPQTIESPSPDVRLAEVG